MKIKDYLSRIHFYSTFYYLPAAFIFLFYSEMYAFPNKQAETWQCVMFLVVTTEVHVKRASFSLSYNKRAK